MLFLPDLKFVVADFLSRPTPPEPTGNVAAAVAADLRSIGRRAK
jgi:hypothetical protein